MGEGEEEGGGGQGGGGGGGGEQIKSCQMEILGFKRSETGVRIEGLPSLRRLYVSLVVIIFCGVVVAVPRHFPLIPAVDDHRHRAAS